MSSADHLGNGGGWKLIEDNPVLGLRRYRMDIDDKYAVQKTIHYRTEQLLDLNADQRAATAGQRWGDGQFVARVPLNKLWEEVMPAQLQGDEKYVNRWLNDADNARFRVKEGKL